MRSRAVSLRLGVLGRDALLAAAEARLGRAASRVPPRMCFKAISYARAAKTSAAACISAQRPARRTLASSSSPQRAIW